MASSMASLFFNSGGIQTDLKKTSIKEDMLEWDNIEASVEQTIRIASESLEGKKIENVDFSMAISLLKDDLEKLQGIFDRLSEEYKKKVLEEEGEGMCALSKKKLKVYGVATVETLSQSVGIVSLAVDTLGANSNNNNNSLKWAAFSCVMAGAVLSKLNDYFWNQCVSWEEQKRKLEEFRAKSVLIENTESMLHIFESYDAMKKEQSSSLSSRELLSRLKSYGNIPEKFSGGACSTRFQMGLLNSDMVQKKLIQIAQGDDKDRHGQKLLRAVERTRRRASRQEGSLHSSQRSEKEVEISASISLNFECDSDSSYSSCDDIPDTKRLANTSKQVSGDASNLC